MFHARILQGLAKDCSVTRRDDAYAKNELSKAVGCLRSSCNTFVLEGGYNIVQKERKADIVFIYPAAL